LGLAVVADSLTKRFGSALAVDSLSFGLAPSTITGFLGPNGAGKTTTLRMLLGLIKPTAGTAVVAGHRPGHPDGLRKLGAIIETPAFYPYLSGWDNMRVVADYAGVPYDKIKPALDQVDLTPRAKDKFGTYSMGMKQRLGVAAALVKDPELLVLDEPTNGLDPQGMIDMRNLIVELGKGNRTVLISSHLLGEAEQMCTRVGVIQHGKLVAEGKIEELRGQAFLIVVGSPPDKTLEVLQGEVGAAAVTRDSESEFRVQVEAARVPEINAKLVGAGVAVSELRMTEKSLEDVFLELTGTEGGL
jgi:ABC-2 type transport system ATP-binding protein